jgi:putative transposase
VPARVSPTERIRAEIDQLFTTDQDLGETLEAVARLGARLLLQAALEAEVTTFLGRDRYARGERIRPGHRNGHAPVTVKTTAGPVTLDLWGANIQTRPVSCQSAVVLGLLP